MAYVTPEMINEMRDRYGNPRHLSMSYEILPSEMEMVRGSRKNARNHDITMFIFHDRSYSKFAAIAKHMFPQGVFRAPSGGANPGESLQEAALREAMEETGLEIVLDRFILLINAHFTTGAEAEDWRSLVFTAFCQDGELNPIDKLEVREAIWLSVDELQGPVRRKLLETGMGLFAYRVALHDASIREIGKLRGA
jgi:8-oxo-dGTP pyrophosphatase MutT (NUDIX family)